MNEENVKMMHKLLLLARRIPLMFAFRFLPLNFGKVVETYKQ